MAVEYLYLNRDNTIDRTLRADSTALSAVQMAAITRVTITFGDTTIDSDTAGFGSGQPFDCDTRGSEGVLVMELGAQDIDAGQYLAELVVYDTANTNGIQWGTIPIVVED